jgi:hypothetical protein|mmetsp:Transcript_15416/g.27882  ORF Transcript_15416/g.27882 Transcript_15416/m.27882 type:complete len:158 (+) Transcript_15416:1086-1559(+)
MCIVHSLVSAAVHLAFPAAPGSNTLIFGCNLRGTGFHCHQDAVPSLKAKNAPLIRRQPVVTTVFYEQPQVGSGKEVVLWKPILNFSPVQSKSSGTREYLGARVLPTLHGIVNAQRAEFNRVLFMVPFMHPTQRREKDSESQSLPELQSRTQTLFVTT